MPERSAHALAFVLLVIAAAFAWGVELSAAAADRPAITEFMADNSGPLVDEDGEVSDWIEIYNPGPEALDLLNWTLTDDPFGLVRWQFPSTTLMPNAYLIVFASGKDRFVSGSELHTDFRLAKEGGYLALLNPSGSNMSSFVYPAQRMGISFGTAAFGAAFFFQPTPGVANSQGVLGFVDDTKFSFNRGIFYTPFNLSITCATPGASIVYTTNGNEPLLGGGILVAANNATSPPVAVLPLAATTVVRAAAYKEGFVSSGIDTHSYIFPPSVVNQTRPPGASASWIEDPPGSGSFPADFTVTASVVNNAVPGYSFTNGLVSIPTVSVVSPMDGLFGPVNGIYTRALMEGTNWERAVSVELIHPDGRPGFHSTAGAQIHGDVSALPHTIPKHPLRLFFRGRYGANKLQHPLFPGPVDEFDQLILHGCSTDAWPISNDVDFLWRNQDATYQRDQWVRDTQLAMGQLSARGVYVHLYLNGLYWGLYNLTERINDSFASDHLGGSKEEYDVIQGEFNGNLLHVASAGSDATWNMMLQTANSVPGTPAKYWEIQGMNPDGTRNTALPVLLDVDNLIDYMLLHIYAAAVDWPNRNWWATRRRDSAEAFDSTGFKFLAWDQEVAIDRLDRTIGWNHNRPIELVNQPDTPAQVYDRLRTHAEFRLRFADHIQKYLFNGGVLTVASNRARWASRAAEIDRAMVGESARWGDAKRTPAYTRETDWLRMSNFTQNTYWPSNETLAMRRFRNAGLYPVTGVPVFNQFGGAVPSGFQLVMTHTNGSGIVYYTVDGRDPRLPGGAVVAGANQFTQALSITSPTLVRARVLNGADWSALVEAQFLPPQDLSALQFSEIMYNPRAGDLDGDEYEFVELKNTGPVILDLSELTFTQGIGFTFTNGTLLNAGGFMVLARNHSAFASRYGDAPLNGVYTGRLDNNGEALTLSTSQGGRLSVVYDNNAPWPGEADNSGLSLQRMSFTASVTNPVSWVAAPPTPGEGPEPGLVDSDDDGLPDGWELTHGFIVGEMDGDRDTDLDGSNNRGEFVTGTDPRDANDVLRVTSLVNAVIGSNIWVRIEFLARSNKTYTVVYRDTMAREEWTSLANVTAAPTNRWVRVPDMLPGGLSSRFYRLASPKLP
jgi:hypothetical protein